MRKMIRLFYILLITIIVMTACVDTGQSVTQPVTGHSSSWHDSNDPLDICHDNMVTISAAITMFYGAYSRYPDDLPELETIVPGVCSLQCPSCEEFYGYHLNSAGDEYILSCPLPTVPNHGYVVNGECSWPPDPSEYTEICHSNMIRVSTAIGMFYGIYGRFPDGLRELEIVAPRVCSIQCPSCEEFYGYHLNSAGDEYILSCPLPTVPNHGHVVNGECSWPPDPSEYTEICHSNMMSLTTGCSMFYAMFNRFPEKLRELGTSGIMENWDLECPACCLLYIYETDTSGQTFTIHCPLPTVPNHGSVVDGYISW